MWWLLSFVFLILVAFYCNSLGCQLYDREEQCKLETRIKKKLLVRLKFTFPLAFGRPGFTLQLSTHWAAGIWVVFQRSRQCLSTHSIAPITNQPVLYFCYHLKLVVLSIILSWLLRIVTDGASFKISKD